MDNRHLYIKNMVCDRCLMAVRDQLNAVGLPYHNLQLGEVELDREATPNELADLGHRLENLGFELLDDRKSRLVERIKGSIISLVHHRHNDWKNRKLSAWLQEQLHMDYHYLSTLFSSVEGITLEKYVILQRVERVKELLRYDEMNLSEIAFELGYSSVQHLSQQFKKVTGLTPTHFKALRENTRKPLDKIGGGNGI